MTDYQTAEKVAGLPELGRDAIVFVSRYYDGPLSGLCRRADGSVAFFAPVLDSWPVTALAVFPLSDAEQRRELRSKELFETHVGTFWSWDLPREQRTFGDCEGGGNYETAMAAEFGDDSDDEVAERGYVQRAPVAVIRLGR